MRTGTRTRLRWVATIGALVIAIVVCGAMALNPVAAWGTRRLFARVEGYRTTFRSVDVNPTRLAYVVNGLQMDATQDGPAITHAAAERARIALDAHALLTGRIVARVEVDAPEVRVVTTGGGTRLDRVKSLGLPAGIPAVLIGRLEIRDGQATWTDASKKSRPTLRLGALDATVENFATTAAVATGHETSLKLEAQLQHSGKVHASAHTHRGGAATFSGTAEIADLRLTDLAGVIEAASDFTPEAGTVSETLDIRSNQGEITGHVRSIVRSPDFSSQGDGPIAALKGLAADVAVDVFEQHLEGGDDPALVTSIPITGTVGDKSRALPTFIAIAGTALARGLHEGLSIPPGTDQPTVVRGAD